MPLWKSWTYSPLPTTVQDAATAPNLQQPNLLDVIKSKRVRLLGAAIATLLITGYVAFGTWGEITTRRLQSVLTPAPAPVPSGDNVDVDWSRFAYTQYVTETAYLCNSVMLFEILHRLGSKADRLLMYPSTFSLDIKTTQGKLLLKAQDEYGAKLQPITIQTRPDSRKDTWTESYTKLLAFNQTQYSRVLSLDSDSTILKTMDELFLLPPCPVAMPRAYWIKTPPTLSSQLVLITPSTAEFSHIEHKIKTAEANEFDMEIVNTLYGDSALVLPHRPYNLLTGEFRHLENHTEYLGSTTEVWDATKALEEAKFLHFSDWPVPKPWLDGARSRNELMPGCLPAENGGKEDCTQRDMWLGFYKEFAERRKDVCGLDIY